MTITRFSPNVGSKHRSKHLAVVVLPSEAIAFQAYRLLHYHGISPENLAIVGEGFSDPDRVGLVGPLKIAQRKAKLFGCKAAVLGFALGVGLLSMSDVPLERVLSGSALISGVSGVCGAAVGALFGLWGEGGKANAYRRHLRQGRYLLMMEGQETLVKWGQEVLGHYYVSGTD